MALCSYFYRSHGSTKLDSAGGQMCWIPCNLACCLLNRNGYMYVEGDPVNMVDPSGRQALEAFATPSCSFVTEALRHGTLDEFIQRNAHRGIDLTNAGRDNAIRLLTTNFQTCRNELFHYPGLGWGMEYNLRLMVNGFNLRQAPNLNGICPMLADSCSDLPRMLQYGIGTDMLRSCLPITLSNGTSLEHVLGFVQPRQGNSYDSTQLMLLDDGSDFKRLMIGLRVDASGELVVFGHRILGPDINFEVQVIPHHVLLEYWGRESLVGIAVSPGIERSFGPLDFQNILEFQGGVSGGVVFGLIDAPDHAQWSSAATVGGQTTIGGGFEIDVTNVMENGDKILYIGVGGGVEQPSVYGTGAKSIFIDPVPFGLQIAEWLGLVGN